MSWSVRKGVAGTALPAGGRELASVPGVAVPKVVLAIWEAGDAARRMR